MDKMLGNNEVIEAHNKRFRAGKETFTRSLWKRSDLSFEEKQKLLTGSKDLFSNTTTLQASGDSQNRKASPQSVNWTADGLVNAVDDQQTCGKL